MHDNKTDMAKGDSSPGIKIYKSHLNVDYVSMKKQMQIKSNQLKINCSIQRVLKNLRGELFNDCPSIGIQAFSKSHN